MSYLMIEFKDDGVKVGNQIVKYDNQQTSRLDFQIYVFKDRVNFYYCNRFNKKFDMPCNTDNITAIFVGVFGRSCKYEYYQHKDKQEIFANIAFDEKGRVVDSLILPNIKNVEGDMD